MPDIRPGLSESVARNLAARRAYLRLKQTDVAARAGIAPATVSAYEVGARTVRLDALPALCEALSCTLPDLLAGADPDDLRRLGLS